MKKLCICMIVICAFVLQGIAFAEDSLKEQIAKKYAENDKNIDPVIRDFLKQGIDPRELVKDCVQLGYEVCHVVIVSLKEGADRQLVIFGALDGGATNDDLNRCEGLGYSYDPPATIDPPKTNPVSGSVPTVK